MTIKMHTVLLVGALLTLVAIVMYLAPFAALWYLVQP